MTSTDIDRAEWVNGLRAMADWFEQHPERIPLWNHLQINLFPGDKAELAVLAREFGRAVKDGDDRWFHVKRPCGPHSISGTIEREQVCRKIVTGTKIVPAQPEREVEVVEWVCDEPVLAAIGGDSDA